MCCMCASAVIPRHLVDVEIFKVFQRKGWAVGCTRWKLRGSPHSAGFILWMLCTVVLLLTLIHNPHTFPCPLLLQLSPLLLSFSAPLSWFYPWTPSLAPLLSVLLDSPPTFISFSSVRGNLVFEQQSRSPRDSLHLNTWKRLLIMSLDFGGIIGRHI